MQIDTDANKFAKFHMQSKLDIIYKATPSYIGNCILKSSMIKVILASATGKGQKLLKRNEPLITLRRICYSISGTE